MRELLQQRREVLHVYEVTVDTFRRMALPISDYRALVKSSADTLAKILFEIDTEDY